MRHVSTIASCFVSATLILMMPAVHYIGPITRVSSFLRFCIVNYSSTELSVRKKLASLLPIPCTSTGKTTPTINITFIL